jgi:hypothetical protein
MRELYPTIGIPQQAVSNQNHRMDWQHSKTQPTVSRFPQWGWPALRFRTSSA